MKQNLIFGLVFGRLAVLKISVIEQKYATFEGSFFYVFTDKRNRLYLTTRLICNDFARKEVGKKRRKQKKEKSVFT